MRVLPCGDAGRGKWQAVKIYVEIHESRVYSVTLDARSIEEAEAHVGQLHRDNELPFETYHVETVAVLHPCERAA